MKSPVEDSTLTEPSESLSNDILLPEFRDKKSWSSGESFISARRVSKLFGERELSWRSLRFDSKDEDFEFSTLGGLEGSIFCKILLPILIKPVAIIGSMHGL
jgi:hypothetical protein